jgi:methylmalonyl-CoA mutase N-terminal domain/subunit
VIAHETGVAIVADPLGGSDYVEWMTDEMERRATDVFAHLDDLGGGSILEGVYAGIESGWFAGEIADAAYRYEREVNAGDRIVVGVNAFTEGGDGERARLLRIGQDTEDLQLKRLEGVKQARDDRAVADALRRVAVDAAEPATNLMPALMEAVAVRTTVGEIVEALEGVFGTYVEQAVV